MTSALASFVEGWTRARNDKGQGNVRSEEEEQDRDESIAIGMRSDETACPSPFGYLESCVSPIVPPSSASCGTGTTCPVIAALRSATLRAETRDSD